MAGSANLPLGFALLAVGGIAVTAGLTGDSWADVVQGRSGTVARKTALAVDDGLSIDAGAVRPGELGGFRQVPGTDFSRGDGPELARRLAALGRKLHATVYGISGYRDRARNAAVGGAPGSHHLTGDAADVGLGAPTRASFAGVPESALRSVGLYRPIPGDPREVNHVALLPGWRG